MSGHTANSFTRSGGQNGIHSRVHRTNVTCQENEAQRIVQYMKNLDRLICWEIFQGIVLKLWMVSASCSKITQESTQPPCIYLSTLWMDMVYLPLWCDGIGTVGGVIVYCSTRGYQGYCVRARMLHVCAGACVWVHVCGWGCMCVCGGASVWGVHFLLTTDFLHTKVLR